MTATDIHEPDDVFVYSIDNMLQQIRTAPLELGFYTLKFYSDGKRPVKHHSGQIDTFYYYPSGGTLRDKDMNIVFYEPRLDKYHRSNKLPRELEDDAFSETTE
jgi:hypothetical protein